MLNQLAFEGRIFPVDQILHRRTFIFYPPARVSRTRFDKMTNNTKVDEKLEGDDNFRAWKYRMILILEENDLEKYVE